MYRTMSIRIKKGHRLFPYFEDLTLHTCNLYNSTNFYVRQVFTGLSKDPALRHANETEVIERINSCLRSHPRFREVTAENPGLSYEMMDYVFKHLRHEAYYSLPAQANQQVMKEVFEAWKSFYASVKGFRAWSQTSSAARPCIRSDPRRFNGRPKPPGYTKKGAHKTVTLTNQICVIKENRYLKLPKTKAMLNIGKLGEMGRLQEVRIVPGKGIFTIQLVLSIEEPAARDLNRDNILGIDLGVNNFAAVTNNLNRKPFILNGKPLKSINQYYNKERARLMGILRHGKSPKTGRFSSRRLDGLDRLRNDRIKDFLHKASRQLVDYCVAGDIGTIVMGMNEHFKREVRLGKPAKQNFMTIPYASFAAYMEYKCEAAGIRLVVTEESYTSKASFPDRDVMPVYGDKNVEQEYSGRRIKRGLYQSQSGMIINADCNGSGNIIRKVFPDAFCRGDRGVVDTPVVLSIA